MQTALKKNTEMIKARNLKKYLVSLKLLQAIWAIEWIYLISCINQLLIKNVGIATSGELSILATSKDFLLTKVEHCLKEYQQQAPFT